MNLKDVIKKPIITEKSSMAMRMGWYTFEVDNQATKQDVKRAVEKYFKVKVIKVRTMRFANIKKAMVRLNEGEKIEAFQTGE